MFRTSHTLLKKMVRFFPLPSQGHTAGSKDHPFYLKVMSLNETVTSRKSIHHEILIPTLVSMHTPTHSHAKHLPSTDVIHFSFSFKQIKNKQNVYDNGRDLHVDFVLSQCISGRSFVHFFSCQPASPNLPTIPVLWAIKATHIDCLFVL